MSGHEIWEAILQQLGAILLYRWNCTSTWWTERSECTVGSKKRAKLFFNFIFRMSYSSKLYLKRAPSNEIWKSKNPFTDTLHLCSSRKSHASSISLNKSVFVMKTLLCSLWGTNLLSVHNYLNIRLKIVITKSNYIRIHKTPLIWRALTQFKRSLVY
jgi:hypothetical protein